MKRFMLAMAIIGAFALTSCKEEKNEQSTEASGQEEAGSLEFPRTIHYQCGDKLVEFTLLSSSKADMRIANVSYAMEQVVTASGAKYENLGGPDTYLWNKGDKATVSINGETLPECAETEAPQAKNDNVWVLEDINNQGIIDNSHLTIMFGEDGRVSGSAGCNSYGGSYTLEKEVLNIGENLVTTLRACLSEAMGQQEGKFLDILPRMTKSQTDDTGALILSNDKGERLLFRKE